MDIKEYQQYLTSAFKLNPQDIVVPEVIPSFEMDHFLVSLYGKYKYDYVSGMGYICNIFNAIGIKPSSEDPNMVAYFATPQKKEANIRLKQKPGRFFKILFPDLDDHVISSMVTAYKEKFVVDSENYTFHTTEDADEIERIYTSTPTESPTDTYYTYSKKYLNGSCMRHRRINHPVRAYASGDWALAYALTNDGKLAARCIIIPKLKLRQPIYVNTGNAYDFLDEKLSDYKDIYHTNDTTGMVGLKLLPPAVRSWDRGARWKFHVPYIDYMGTNRGFSYTDDGYLVLDNDPEFDIADGDGIVNRVNYALKCSVSGRRFGEMWSPSPIRVGYKIWVDSSVINDHYIYDEDIHKWVKKEGMIKYIKLIPYEATRGRYVGHYYRETTYINENEINKEDFIYIESESSYFKKNHCGLLMDGNYLPLDTLKENGYIKGELSGKWFKTDDLGIAEYWPKYAKRPRQDLIGYIIANCRQRLVREEFRWVEDDN